METLSPSEIHERFAGIVAKSLRIDPSQVTPDASLADLGAESLDLIEITMEAEDEFAIVMPQKERTANGAGRVRAPACSSTKVVSPRRGCVFSSAACRNPTLASSVSACPSPKWHATFSARARGCASFKECSNISRAPVPRAVNRCRRPLRAG